MTRAAELTFPLAGLLAEPPGTESDYPIAGVTIQLDDGLRLAEPIAGDLRIVRTNRGVLVRARLRAALEGECARCLNGTVTPLRLTIHEEALPSVDLLTGHEIDRNVEPDVVRLTSHHELDLEPLLREAVELAEPIAPLCEPDCPGLCADCGERLGEDHEPHLEGAIDPRFAALQAFRVDGEAENG